MKKWIVYEHISPSGKVYVGITCQKPQRRWKGGAGYIRKDNHQPLFANAILKYGWDNIEHKIIASGLTKIEADTIEQTLIAKYKREHRSYNITNGGDGGLGTTHTEETKRYLSKIKKGTKVPKEEICKRVNNRIDNYTYYIVAIRPEEIKTFRTTKEAAEALGIANRCNISACVHGKQCLTSGWVFEHWDKDIPLDEEFLYELYNERFNNRYSSERRQKL